jgi:hypothetical protein
MHLTQCDTPASSVFDQRKTTLHGTAAEKRHAARSSHAAMNPLDGSANFAAANKASQAQRKLIKSSATAEVNHTAR